MFFACHPGWICSPRTSIKQGWTIKTGVNVDPQRWLNDVAYRQVLVCKNSTSERQRCPVVGRFWQVAKGRMVDDWPASHVWLLWRFFFSWYRIYFFWIDVSKAIINQPSWLMVYSHQNGWWLGHSKSCFFFPWTHHGGSRWSPQSCRSSPLGSSSRPWDREMSRMSCHVVTSWWWLENIGNHPMAWKVYPDFGTCFCMFLLNDS